MSKLFFSSMTRNTDLAEVPFDVLMLDRAEWQTGDFVVCEATGTANKLYRTELVSGRRPQLTLGDQVVGVLGRREATLEYVGDWRAVGDDLTMHSLTAAGLFGKLTSRSSLMPMPMEVRYRGHVTRVRKLGLRDFLRPVAPRTLEIPVVMVLGTSMSAGKTTAARQIVSMLAGMGHRVAGAKMIGAGGHKDALTYEDAGAAFVIDFVDVGLPSTACPLGDLERGLGDMLARVAESDCTVLVAELGAAPHDPYNGILAVERLRPLTRLSVLVASDGYAALGLQTALEWQPDVIAGAAANTTAAIGMTKRLTGGLVLDLSQLDGAERLRGLLAERVGQSAGAEPVRPSSAVPNVA